jgi:hypothetical protein
MAAAAEDEHRSFCPAPMNPLGLGRIGAYRTYTPEPWAERVSSWVETQARPFVVGAVLEEACGVPVGHQDRRAQMRVAAILRGLGCEKKTLSLEVEGVTKARRCWGPSCC